MSPLRTAVTFILMAGLPAHAAADGERLISIEMSGACLDTIWQTVNAVHYDSTFGGVDWQAVHARYRARLGSLRADRDFIRLMNQMLQELGLSHYAVFRTEERAAAGSPLLSEGCLGLDTRWLAREAVICSVRPGYPAALAGLRPGFVIDRVDDVPVSRLIEDAAADLPPHLNERGRLNTVADAIAGRFFGPVGTAVKLGYRDAADAEHEVTLEMKARTGKTILADDYPPFYVDFTARRLPGDIGYISFSGFLPPIDEQFIAAIDSMTGLRGLILDIRGNPGGSHEVGEAIAGKLVREETPFSIFRHRAGTEQVVLQPNPPTYDGPVVILLDVMNGSASERFSACMQSIGRALVIGERSPGLVGPSEIKPLPNGASFMYLIAQSLTPGGTVLEGHGVIPDIPAGLDRQSLLAGVDAQLQRAIAAIDSASE